MKNVMVSLFCCVALLACESAGDQAKPEAVDSASAAPVAEPAAAASVVVDAPVAVDSAAPAVAVSASAAPVAAPSASAVVDTKK